MCIAADFNLVKVGDAYRGLGEHVGRVERRRDPLSDQLVACCHFWILVDGRDGGLTATGSPWSRHWLSPPRRCASEQKRRTLRESISPSR